MLSILATLTGGCSVIGVRTLPDAFARADEPECTESVAAPVADTVGAAVMASLAIATVAEASRDRDTCDRDDASDDWCFDLDFSGLYVGTALVTGLAALTYGLSAGHGYTATAECREAHDAWERTRTHLKALEASERE